MARFCSFKPRKERPERFANTRCQRMKTLAGTRFNERAHQQHIQLPLRFALAHGLAQLLGIAPRPQTHEANAKVPRHLPHLLEVAQLFARQARQLQGKPFVFGVGEHKRQCRGRRLLLAIGVVDDQQVALTHGFLQPGFRGSGQQ